MKSPAYALLTLLLLLSFPGFNNLAAQGFTGKGTTIVFFAFDGFEQADLDTFVTTYRLPKFTPTVVGWYCLLTSSRPNYG